MNIETDTDIEAAFQRMLAAAKRRKAEIAEKLKSYPNEKPCERHPEVTRTLSAEATERATIEAWNKLTVVYTPCPLCAQEQAVKAESARLIKAGVPEILVNATLDNWEPRNETEQSYLSTAQEFARTKRGFLILVGAVGTGKSHLAVAIARQYHRLFFIKQTTLLRRLRLTYNDRTAVDPRPQAENADLLVLDEMGLGYGGRDELPMLHDILDYRHSEKLPTILTGNITFDELRQIVGDRVGDRLRQSAFAVLEFGGQSNRANMRGCYFED